MFNDKITNSNSQVIPLERVDILCTHHFLFPSNQDYIHQLRKYYHEYLL